MEQPGQTARSPVAKITAAVLVLIGILGPLLVPIYARTAPKLGPWPFFYWYQLIWVPIVAILVSGAYYLQGRSGAGNGKEAGQ